METTHNMHGVTGQLTRIARKDPSSRNEKSGKLTFMHQKFKASRQFNEDGVTKRIVVDLRFDDSMGNGHNEFSMTAEIWNPRHPEDSESGGIIHKAIAKHFPELAHLAKWHLCSTDGPMHYPGNVTYFAGDLDHHGKRQGEPWAWDDVAYVGNSPFPTKIKSSRFLEWMQARIDFLVSTPKANKHWSEFKVVAASHTGNDTYKYSDNYTLEGYEANWALCPFNDSVTAQAWADSLNLHVESLRKKGAGFIRFEKVPTLFSEGKARELDKARSSAVWPDATDEQLCLPKAELTAILMARLPALLAAMKEDMEAAGFEWEVTQ